MTAKHGVVPTVAIRTPASAGPITLAPFMMTPLRLTALARSAAGTSWPTNVWRAGPSTTDTRPLPTLRYTMNAMASVPVATPTHSVAASNASAVCVASNNRRRSNRSARAPPHGPSNSCGSEPDASTKPRDAAEPVCWNTSHPRAVCCRNVPLAEGNWPTKKRRKSRCRSARKGLAAALLARCRRGHHNTPIPSSPLSRFGSTETSDTT